MNQRHFTSQDVKQVHNLIEHCLLQYMNKEQVVQTLQNELQIEPHFTQLVWQKLEEENKEFFESYNESLERMKNMELKKQESHHISGVLPQQYSNLNFTAITPLSSSYDGLHDHDHAVLSQPNSKFDMPQSAFDFDGSHDQSRIGSIIPAFDFDWPVNPTIMPQVPNSNVGLIENGIGSFPTFEGSHEQPQSSSNVNLIGNEFTSLPTFNFNIDDGSHNCSSAVLSQPSLDVSHIPSTLPKYPECYYSTDHEHMQFLMATNIQHSDSDYTNSSFDLQTSMHGPVDVINDPSNLFSTQGNGEMIESRPEYSGFVPLNGQMPLSYGFGSPLL